LKKHYYKNDVLLQKGVKGPLASYFVLDFIPQNYLVDSSGKIIAKNLSSEEIERKFGKK